MEDVNGRVGLGDGIKQGGETVYEALCSGVDPVFRDNKQIRVTEVGTREFKGGMGIKYR